MSIGLLTHCILWVSRVRSAASNATYVPILNHAGPKTGDCKENEKRL